MPATTANTAKSNTVAIDEESLKPKYTLGSVKYIDIADVVAKFESKEWKHTKPEYYIRSLESLNRKENLESKKDAIRKYHGTDANKKIHYYIVEIEQAVVLEDDGSFVSGNTRILAAMQLYTNPDVYLPNLNEVAKNKNDETVEGELDSELTGYSFEYIFRPVPYQVIEGEFTWKDAYSYQVNTNDTVEAHSLLEKMAVLPNVRKKATEEIKKLKITNKKVAANAVTQMILSIMKINRITLSQLETMNNRSTEALTAYVRANLISVDSATTLLQKVNKLLNITEGKKAPDEEVNKHLEALKVKVKTQKDRENIYKSDITSYFDDLTAHKNATPPQVENQPEVITNTSTTTTTEAGELQTDIIQVEGDTDNQAVETPETGTTTVTTPEGTNTTTTPQNGSNGEKQAKKLPPLEAVKEFDSIKYPDINSDIESSFTPAHNEKLSAVNAAMVTLITASTEYVDINAETEVFQLLLPIIREVLPLIKDKIVTNNKEDNNEVIKAYRAFSKKHKDLLDLMFGSFEAPEETEKPATTKTAKTNDVEVATVEIFTPTEEVTATFDNSVK